MDKEKLDELNKEKDSIEEEQGELDQRRLNNDVAIKEEELDEAKKKAEDKKSE